MFKALHIIDEADPILRKKAGLVVFPISKEEKKIIRDVIMHLKYSQIEDKCLMYNLRPGMGLAFPQVGILKRIIIVVHEFIENEFKEYVIVNPKIVSHSLEQIAAFEGEGCLSVNRDVLGHVLRYARVTVEGFDQNGKKVTHRVRDEVAIAFQHEIDHLEGILFCDRIDVDKPYYTDDEIRLI